MQNAAKNLFRRGKDGFRELVLTWVSLDFLAPSGGNSRPWHIEISAGDQPQIILSIASSYRAHKSLMDLDGSSSVIALGTLAKTIETLAALDSYQTNYQVESLSQSYWDCLIKLSFTPTINLKAEFSLDTLYRRHTHRKACKPEPISQALVESLSKISSLYSEVCLLNFTPQVPQLMPHLLKLEYIRWANRSYLDDLISEINFSPTRKNQDKGIWIGDLGLSVPDKVLFKALKKFPSIRSGIQFFLKQIAPKKSIASLIKNSGGLFYLRTKRNDLQSLFSVGLCYQHLWLAIVKAGLGFQPVSPTLIAYNYWQTFDHQLFSHIDKNIIEMTTDTLTREFLLDPKFYALGFRCGYFK